jgi:tripartite-type tricarboxylate transporter receptor subunit TctC
MNSVKLSRRVFAAFALAAPLVTIAQDSKPIEWVVGYPAGGGSDAVARVIAEQMAKTLRREVQSAGPDALHRGLRHVVGQPVAVREAAL